MKDLVKNNLLSLILFAIIMGIGLYFYPQLPSTVATKFDLNGNPIQQSSKEFVVFFIPLLYLFLIFFMGLMVKASPQQYAMPNSQKSMGIIAFGTGFIFLGIHLGMLLNPGSSEVFVKYFSFGVALFLMIVGNIFGKTERNFFMGIRMPWTLASEENWRATHRFAGVMMVIFGAALLLASFVFTSMPVVLACLLIPVISPAIYSFYYFKKYEKINSV